MVNFTIGQRKGLGVAQTPLYVIEINPENHDVILGSKEDLKRNIYIRDVNWIGDNEFKPTGSRIKNKAKIRSSQEPKLLVYLFQIKVYVNFEEDVEGVSLVKCVFYDANNSSRVLGGGWITQ